MSISVGDASSIVSVGLSVAGVLGTAVTWLWARVEKSNKEIRAELRKCSEREIRGREKHLAMTTIVELLWQEVERLTPDAKILKRARKLLDDMKFKDAAQGGL